MNRMIIRWMAIGVIATASAGALAQTTRPTTATAAEVSRLEARLIEAQMRLTSLRGTYLDAHPDVAAEMRFIESLERQLAEPTPPPSWAVRPPTTNPKLLEARMRLDRLETQLPRMEFRHGTESRFVRQMKAQIDVMHWHVGNLEMELREPTTQPAAGP